MLLAAIKTAVAVLVPGQGSQSPLMRQTVIDHAEDLYCLAIEEVGGDPFSNFEAGTRFTQPAIYCTSIALWRQYVYPKPHFIAGHSLGEYAGLVAAGSVSAEDGLRLVALRGRLMQESGELQGDCGMIAVLGLTMEDVQTFADASGLTVANDNSPGQIVLSGAIDQLELGKRLAREQGLRALRLPVHGAFHSPAMEDAVPHFREALNSVHFKPPRVEVFSASTAQPFKDIRKELAEAITKPVLWRQTILALHARGVRRFIELGPGKILTGLGRRTLQDADFIEWDKAA